MDRTRWGARSAKAAIIALMVVLSLTLWIANPVLWMWITSLLQSGRTQPSMGPYGLMIAGVILTGVLVARLLTRLNRLYQEITGTLPTVQIIVPWRRSWRGERDPGADEDGRVPVSLLDVVMVVSVVVAVIAFATWFMVVQPTPPGLEPGPAK